MTAVEPVGNAINLVLAHDIREVDMGVVNSYTEVEDHIYASPVAKTDGHTIGILSIEALDILGKLYNEWTNTLMI